MEQPGHPHEPQDLDQAEEAQELEQAHELPRLPVGMGRGHYHILAALKREGARELVVEDAQDLDTRCGRIGRVGGGGWMDGWRKLLGGRPLGHRR